LNWFWALFWAVVTLAISEALRPTAGAGFAAESAVAACCRDWRSPRALWPMRAEVIGAALPVVPLAAPAVRPA
jgi:hypothetical protein